MTYLFSTADEDGLLVARVAGVRPTIDGDTLEQLWQFFEGVAAQCRAKGIKRLLTVSAASGPTTSTAVLSFYRRLAFFGFDPTMRLAVVILDREARRTIELGVAVAESSGWDIKVFGTEEQARRWLDGPPTSADGAESGTAPRSA